MRRLIAGILTVVGCAPAPPEPSVPQRPTLAAAPTPATAEAPPEPVAAEPKSELSEVSEPANVACRLRADEWHSSKLRLSASGQVFAHVYFAPAEIVVPAENEPEAMVAVLDDREVVIRAILKSNDAPIYLRAPRLLAGYLAPIASTDLLVRAGKPSSLRVGVPTDDVLSTPDVVEEDVSCEALTIKSVDFDARASITKRPKLPQRSVGPNGADLAKTAGGESVAKLVPDLPVGILEARGGSTRVLVDGIDYFIVGWVRSKDLVSEQSRGIYGMGSGSGYGRFQRSMNTMDVCPRDVPLVAEVGGEVARVGTLRAGSPFRLVPSTTADHDRDRRVPIQLAATVWLRLEKNARITAYVRDLEGCKSEHTPRF